MALLKKIRTVITHTHTHTYTHTHTHTQEWVDVSIPLETSIC